MNKVFSTVEEALRDVFDGATVLIGGFGGSGTPHNLTDGLVAQGASRLTIVCNGSSEWAELVRHGRVARLITGFARNAYDPAVSALLTEGVRSGKLQVELVPHGTLEERCRAAGMGIRAFYVGVGVGTVAEAGKEKRVFDGQEYILEHALKADFALIKGFQADRFGNVVCRLAAGNRNIAMATAANVTVAEVEQIVETGSLDPNRIDIPGIFVHRVVQKPKVVRWLKWKV